MEQIIELIGQEYLIITMLGIIIGYVITSTPYLEGIKDNIPIINTLVGSVLGLLQGGWSLEAVVYGAMAGLISTGLYELFGKKLKSLGEKEELRKDREYKGDDKYGL